MEDVTAMLNEEKSRKAIDMWDPSDFGAPPRISSGHNVTDPPGPHAVYSFHLEDGYCIGTVLLSQGRQVAPPRLYSMAWPSNTTLRVLSCFVLHIRATMDGTLAGYWGIVAYSASETLRRDNEDITSSFGI